MKHPRRPRHRATVTIATVDLEYLAARREAYVPLSGPVAPGRGRHRRWTAWEMRTWPLQAAGVRL